MIDYLMAFGDEVTAIAALPGFHLPASSNDPGGWRGDCVIPGVQVWMDSGDVTTGTDPATGTPIVTHAYLPGFWIVVSETFRNAALETSHALVFGADRGMANAGASPAQFIFIFGPGQSLANFVGAHVSPTFAGSNYPFGASA